MIKPIRRIHGTPLVPVKSLKPVKLNPVQVVDPNLSPEELKEHQTKLNDHMLNYVQKAMAKAEKDIELQWFQDIAEEERNIDAPEAVEASERLRAILDSRPNTREAMKKILPEFADDLDCDEHKIEEKGDIPSPTSARMKF